MRIINILIVLVFVPLFVVSSASGQWLVNQSFEGTFPPTGWQLFNNLSLAWAQNSDRAHSGTYSAAVEYLAGTNVVWLVSPMVDLTSLSKSVTYPWLVYWENVDDGAFADQHWVRISTDWDGVSDPGLQGTWTNLTTDIGTEDTWVQKGFDLSAYATETSVYIAFYYTGNYASSWYIDDVQIGQDPLSIDLLHFNGRQISEGILLDWETASEVDCMGFTILRYTFNANSGEFSKARLLTDNIIPSEGTASSGASYKFVDSKTRPQTTYRYILIEVKGNTEEIDADSVDITTKEFRLPR